MGIRDNPDSNIDRIICTDTLATDLYGFFQHISSCKSHIWSDHSRLGLWSSKLLCAAFACIFLIHIAFRLILLLFAWARITFSHPLSRQKLASRISCKFYTDSICYQHIPTGWTCLFYCKRSMFQRWVHLKSSIYGLRCKPSFLQRGIRGKTCKNTTGIACSSTFSSCHLKFCPYSVYCTRHRVYTDGTPHQSMSSMDYVVIASTAGDWNSCGALVNWLQSAESDWILVVIEPLNLVMVAVGWMWSSEWAIAVTQILSPEL